MQWLFLSEGTNQLFSLILKLKQVKTSEKSSEKSDFRVKRENHFFHKIFHSFSRVSASKSMRKVDLCTTTKIKPLHFPIYPIGRSFLSFMCYISNFTPELLIYIPTKYYIISYILSKKSLHLVNGFNRTSVEH